jgi:hypothetical protein
MEDVHGSDSLSWVRWLMRQRRIANLLSWTIHAVGRLLALRPQRAAVSGAWLREHEADRGKRAQE